MKRAKPFTMLKRTATTLLLTVFTVTSTWADDWPEYITDVVVIGAREREVAHYQDKWRDNGYTVIDQDLLAGAAFAYDAYVYLAYKTAERASTNGGYITDFVVLNTSDPPETWKQDGRTYYKSPYDGYSGSGVISFDGNLNMLTGGWNLYLYYTKDNFDDKRVVSGITFNDTRSGSIDCYKPDGTLEEEDINFNRGIMIASDIYMHLTTPQKTNRPKTDPVARTGTKYNGYEQHLLSGCTIESGTMYYRVGDTGDYVADINLATAKDVGTYTIYYYAGANDYSIQSDVHSKTVSIGKSENSNATVSCQPTTKGETPLPSVANNLSTGAVTYLYSATEDGEYSETAPSSVGKWWVKAAIAADGNCNEYTTAPASFWMTDANLVFADNANNSSVIASHNGECIAATLSGRTLYKDGNWNTLCLPFDLVLEGSPLEGARVKTLTSTAYADGTLTLNFSDDLTSIEAGKPYIVKWDADLVISTPEDWTEFAQKVNDGTEDYSGKTVRLDADIEVSDMVGTESNRFRGTFDGNGHTLTFNKNIAADCCAPFRYANAAIIRNLHVTGTITTSQKFAAGIIANTTGNTIISNCRSSITITSKINGDGTHGGLIANISGGKVLISDCLFDGTMAGNKTTNCGGFVGWTETDNAATVTFSKCLFNPAEVDLADGCKTFARARQSTSVTINDGFYKTILGEEQGIDARTMELLPLTLGLGINWEKSGDNLVPIMNAGAVDITSPLFSGVTINKTLTDVKTQYADFIGIYNPMAIASEDKSILYMDTNNTLHYPNAAMNIHAFRSYFLLKGITAGDPVAGVRAFVLNFDDDATSIQNSKCKIQNEDPAVYNLSGQRLSKLQKGINIVNGKKVLF